MSRTENWSQRSEVRVISHKSQADHPKPERSRPGATGEVGRGADISIGCLIGQRRHHRLPSSGLADVRLKYGADS